jgi:hypothetical protein
MGGRLDLIRVGLLGVAEDVEAGRADAYTALVLRRIAADLEGLSARDLLDATPGWAACHGSAA